jgi:glucose-6-phosphate isomerase
MYTYNNIFCSSGKVGKAGSFESSLEVMRPKVDAIFETIKSTNSQTPYYKVIHKKNLEKTLLDCREIAKNIDDNFDACVYVGMGGAILSPMMMDSISKKQKAKKIYFINTTDPFYFIEIMGNIELTRTAFIIISNSGETSETISMMGAFINEFKKAGLDFKRNFFVCTTPENSTIRRIGNQFNFSMLDYDPDVGGRFSYFSNSAILAAMLMKLDVEALAKGANQVSDDFWNNRENSKPVKAAMDILSAKQHTLAIIAYSSKLKAFSEWYCQIISESLGKDGIGYTPISGMGPQEQHSMLQLYLDGPKDKLYTLIYPSDGEKLKDISVANNILDGNFLQGKPLGSINRTFFEATQKCLINKQLPTRNIILEKLDEEGFGELLMHFTIEIIFLALLLGLDPFDQPGVSAVKEEAARLLSQ